ncbi:hypothetical protein CLD_3194 [Clostridium botulinum B1 str. Okra]|uniref:Uncharacterized protein n=1 Tax=Clostridium botulinum (strain Okra / Type B1) TaxID=498213 RepID=B1IK77_CLOBK|nr:hypothetical protein CLD_3194 [Clostridium botulinum B1 str. Okra]
MIIKNNYVPIIILDDGASILQGENRNEEDYFYTVLYNIC